LCPGGLNVVFVQLETTNDGGWQNAVATDVLNEIERLVERENPRPMNVGVIHYSPNGARIRQRPTDNLDRVRGELARPIVAPPTIHPAYEDAAREAARMLDQARQSTLATGLEPCEFVVFFAYHKGRGASLEELSRAGNTLRRQDVPVLAGCVAAWQTNCHRVEEMASAREHYALVPDRQGLPRAARQLLESPPWAERRVQQVHVRQQLPPELAFVDGSADLAPVSIDHTAAGTTLRWLWTDAAATAAQTVTYRVQPLAMGQHVITGTLRLTDTVGQAREVPLPAPAILTVAEECPPDAPTTVPTPPPSVVPSVAPTSTASPPPTSDRPPTVTPAQPPSPLYLPVVIAERCAPERFYGDVVLVMDLSTSMSRPTASGTPKLEAARAAAEGFVRSLPLSLDGQGRHAQVAIVGFNAEAWLEQPLTADVNAAAAALAALPARQGPATRLDLAFERGAEALTGPARRPENEPVLILLTDGLPSQVPPDPSDGTMATTVLRAAGRAKEAGLTVFTIGVGRTDADADPAERIDAALLAAAASDPGKFYHEPDAEALAQVYAAIGGTLACPSARFFPSRP
jgi:hypothetical protein